MSLLPKSIHWCRRYPTKFNSGRDIPLRDAFVGIAQDRIVKRERFGEFLVSLDRVTARGEVVDRKSTDFVAALTERLALGKRFRKHARTTALPLSSEMSGFATGSDSQERERDSANSLLVLTVSQLAAK